MRQMPVRTVPMSSKQPVALTAVPVYAWANRGPNAMKIWIPLG